MGRSLKQEIKMDCGMEIYNYNCYKQCQSLDSVPIMRKKWNHNCDDKKMTFLEIFE